MSEQCHGASDVLQGDDSFSNLLSPSGMAKLRLLARASCISPYGMAAVQSRVYLHRDVELRTLGAVSAVDDQDNHLHTQDLR